MTDTQNPRGATDLEEEIRVRVHALAFDNRGLNNEVERLRRAIDRVYYSIPTGVNVPLTPWDEAILEILEDARTWVPADA